MKAKGKVPGKVFFPTADTIDFKYMAKNNDFNIFSLTRSNSNRSVSLQMEIVHLQKDSTGHTKKI